MALKMILPTGFFLIGLAFAGPALAQTANNPSRPVPNTAQAAAATPAGPVLRRQQRAADVPSTTEGMQKAPLERESPDDEALNRMINGICRGC